MHIFATLKTLVFEPLHFMTANRWVYAIIVIKHCFWMYNSAPDSSDGENLMFRLQFLSFTIHINCSVPRCLIKVFYLTACAFIGSWWRCIFWMTSPVMLNRPKNDNDVIFASLKSKSTWKPVKWNNRFSSIDIKFIRLGFENAFWIARQALRFQQAFSKPCLVNLISLHGEL